MDPIILGPKRPCPGDLAARPYSSPAATDRLLESLLSLSDPSPSLDLSLERLIDSTPRELDKELLVEAALEVGSALLEAALRSARKRASSHNATAWPLPPDLTVKVFSMLDTRSLCHAAATCSMFNKCAVDPLCYANIDLTAVVPKVNNTVVSTMIQRAGRNLQSLKLGIWPSPSSAEISQSMSYSSRNSIDTSGPSWNEKKPRQGRESSVLSRSCLLALSVDGGTAGALLKRLHLYNIDKIDGPALCTALSACQSLIDLEVIGLHIELRRTLDAVSTYCHSMKRLFLESSETGRDDSLKSTTCLDLVTGCPNLISLALRGFKLQDHKVKILVKGLHYLKVVDFSTSYSITGIFLRNLVNGASAPALEVLILRDCLHLKEVEIARFLSAVLGGDCQLLKYLDISNKDGLSAEEDWNNRCYNPRIPIMQVLEARPDICLVAEFPQEASFVDIECSSNSQVSRSSDGQISSSSSLQMMPNMSLDLSSANSSESNYNSDQGSGNDDGQDAAYVAYDGDSFDDADYQSPW
ncbi:F-box protein At4g02760-like [Dioscorea cayenensis subsp. rotundata]|uniref:F-box protein At4g02760-like n=1 Tax=Dioscorea cayennensis subsp. rotundata TaxID=55577 RepID=A0AB40B0E7_DIOCR|nr:F-box protein At4g02760-like [Dioscorea cayenensis subsp. rotundata]